MNKSFLFRGFCFEADKGGGNGDSTPPANDANPTTPPAGAQNSDTSGENKMVSIERFNEVNNKLKKLEEDAAKATKAQQEADEKRLKEEGKHKELADSLQAKLGDLEPQHKALTERVAQLEEKLAAGLELEIKDWPVEVKALDPGKDADLLARLEWVGKSRALAAKLGAQPPVGGNGRRPAPSGPAGGGKEKKIEPIYDVRRNF